MTVLLSGAWRPPGRRRAAAIDPSVAPFLDGAIRKTGYGGATTELVAASRVAGATTADVCGFDTDQCVLATALALWDAGIEPRILADLSASSGGTGAHLASLAIAARAFGRHNVAEVLDLRAGHRSGGDLETGP